MTFDPATSRRARLLARAGYVAVVLLATLTHLDLDPSVPDILWRLHRAVHFSTRGVDVVDAARNVALFAGFGAAWMVTAARDHPWRTALRIMGIGALLSIGVETVQLISLSRISSINDVTTNTIGALLGALGVVAMARLLRRTRNCDLVAGVPLFGVAGAYVGAISAEMFSPLYRHDFNPGAGGSLLNRFANAWHYLRPLDPARMSLTDIALFWPGGVLVVLALAELGMSSGAACVSTIAGGAVLSAIVEIAHGVAGQPIEVSAIAAHALGIAIGALVGWEWGVRAAGRGTARRRARLLLAGYALLLAAWAWRPFVLRLHAAAVFAQLTVRHFTPLAVLGASEDLFGVMDVAEQFFLYLPLGFLLAAWPLRYRGRLAHVLPGVCLAVVLEVGQLVVRDRLFDVTDLLTQCAAICVGFVVARRAGYEARGELLGGHSRGAPAASPVPKGIPDR